LSAPEIRIDQLTGLRTILAPGRADRPHQFDSKAGEEVGEESCPFCEGREDRTPPEVYAVRPRGGDANTPGWTTRVVPNLYPALAAGEESGHGRGRDPLLAAGRGGEADLFASRPAVGGHEVIVNAPRHATALAALDGEQLAAAVATWRERMRAHSEAAYAQLVVNEGAGAGASLPHTHAQLYALPFVPAAVARERERVGAYAEGTTGGGLLADVLVEEVRRGERLVAIDDEAALLCPWASGAPYMLRIVPRAPQPSFADDGAGAAMLGTALRLLARRFDGPPEMNLWVRTAPRGTERFHWHVDIAPRLTTKAGLELGTGVDINVYPPERAAADLRELLDD
jgi:UDPglucose--hexose-1-phosphate uridylyltransferase